MTGDVSRCPCCGGVDTRPYRGRLAATSCAGCGHLWRESAVTVDYRRKSRRTVLRDDHLQRRLAERLEFIGHLPPGTRVLEVGCAEGHLAAALRRKIPQLRLVGVEPSHDAELARRFFDAVHQTTLLDAAIVGERFDVVMTFHVLEHLADPLQACRHMGGLLSRSGRLLVEVPRGSGHAEVPEDLNPEHIQFFTAASLCCLLNRAGLEVQTLHGGGFESPLYSDSLRVKARPSVARSVKAAQIQSRLIAMLGDRGAIWGIGGDFECHVRPYLAPLNNVVLVDSERYESGLHIDGRAVSAPVALLDGISREILISSYRYEEQIRSSAITLGIPAGRLHSLDEVLSASEST